MSGKEKTNSGFTRILKGVIAAIGVCFLALCVEAILLRNGMVKEALVNPLLAVTVFAASLIGCIAAAQGAKKTRGLQTALPGIILVLLLLVCRWIMGSGKRDMPFTILLAACSAIPAVLVGVKRPRKRRR